MLVENAGGGVSESTEPHTGGSKSNIRPDLQVKRCKNLATKVYLSQRAEFDGNIPKNREVSKGV